MATIAKGMITLVNVNDAYTVSATPNVCAVKADYDGTHPVLDDAYCDITVVRGDVKVPFTITSITPSHTGIKYEVGGTDATKRLALTDVPVDALSGTVTVEVATEDEFVATVIFQYSVMRESTMLDWIKDWENNKTTIGSTYLITPKLFVGKKVEAEADLKVLTGVYIGPDSDNGAGIYGYKQGEDIFHINETGGHIGGWDINNGGIQTQDGTLKILSEGSIISSDKDGNTIWGLYKSGEATFANGNVVFYADGSAEFAGTIVSSSGVIGGWHIGNSVLKSAYMCLDAARNYIGVAANAGATAMDDWNSELHSYWVHLYGGLKMYWNNANDYGLEGYLPQTGIDGGEVEYHRTFKLGNQNMIAGWNFDDVAIWTGNKMNTAQQYTSGSGSITLGSMGLRGNKWYIDSNGDMSFMGGKIKFSASDDGGEIVGWKLNPNRLSTNNVALVSDGSVTGLYMSASADANFNSRASASLENFIDDKGGIYINISDTGAELAAYDQNGKKLFKLKSDGESTIANWNFDNSVIYTGDKATTVGFTANDYSITISTNGLLGYKWKLLQDGSGAIAGGNIAWDTAGNVTIAESVKIGWANLGGTIINSEGVFAGKISANNITAGTISTATIKNSSGTWELNQDGSGKLAKGAIQWQKDGLLTVKNSNLTDVIISGAITTPFRDGYFTLSSNGSISVSTLGLQNNNNVVIPGGNGGWNVGVIIPWTSDYNGFRAIIMNDKWGSETPTDAWTVKAPDGKYFYEDGQQKSTLTLLPRAGVEMIGYGEGSTFKGWIILKRIFAYSHDNGFNLKVMFSGRVDDGNVVDLKTYNGENITVVKQDTGKYRVKFEFPFSSANNYMVFVSGYGNESWRYASVMSQQTTHFDVYTGDDASANDGGFTFMVINTTLLYGYN